MSDFSVVEKIQVIEKKFLEKKNPTSLFVKIISSKRVPRYLTFGDFTIPKHFSSQQNC